MKEILAVIRMDMIGKTKQALVEAGFPCMTARKVMGRGRKAVSYMVAGDGMNFQSATVDSRDQVAVPHRLIPKRMLNIMLADGELDRCVQTILSVNSKGRPGDGKIFVMDLAGAVRVRTGETDEAAL
jgi:nitrogen regulatory protein PII 2